MPIKKKSKINMKEYLSDSFDENDFDDVIEKGKRSFCKYFCEKFQFYRILRIVFILMSP